MAVIDGIKCHTDIVKSVEEIIGCLTQKNLNEPKKIIRFIEWFLLEKNFVIYAGAGTSKSITHDTYKSKNWRELLEDVYEELDNKTGFLHSALARIGTIYTLSEKDKEGNITVAKTVDDFDKDEKVWEDTFRRKGEDLLKEALDKLGPVKFAWSLRWFFDKDRSTTKRDAAINKIVNIFENPETAESELITELVKLPFGEIVTTNYDQNLEIFLNQAKKPFSPVYDEKTLIKKYGNSEPGLFYLHGKAGESNNLVFDKYDYAQLFSKKNQILDYLVRLFLGRGVLYVGFGLDDQTFDYMVSQTRALCGIKADKSAEGVIPKSYSLNRSIEISEDEISALNDLFNIEVIRFNQFTDLPEIIRKLNDIIKYVNGLDITWFKGKGLPKQLADVEKINESATEKFLRMDLEESLKDYRKALGYTMFWTIEDAQGKTEKNYWESIKVICELRRRLALTRSKLRWMENVDEDEQINLIENNIINAAALVEKFKVSYQGKKDRTNRQMYSELLVEEVAIQMLEGRIKYHKGDFWESVKVFEGFTLDSKGKKKHEVLSLVREAIEKIDNNQTLEDYEIKLLETYYFVQCQIDRATSIIGNSQGKNGNQKKIDMEDVAVAAEKVHKNLLDEPHQTNEYKLKTKEFGNIVVIAKWASAIGRFRNFSDFLVKGSEKENIDKLNEIIDILNEGLKYANAKENDCLPSPRWETLKYRYKSRALSLIWLNSAKKNPQDLIDSYTAIQKALELTGNKLVLRIHHVRNLLEMVRLNAISTFGTFVDESNNQRTPSISFAASFRFLENAFNEISKLLPNGKADIETLRENRYIWWLLIQAYETASFWKLVYEGFKKTLTDKPQKSQNYLLREFLKKDNPKTFVEKQYKDFGISLQEEDKHKTGDKMEGRIKSFKAVYDYVEDKLKTCEKINKKSIL